MPLYLFDPLESPLRVPYVVEAADPAAATAAFAGQISVDVQPEPVLPADSPFRTFRYFVCELVRPVNGVYVSEPVGEADVRLTHDGLAHHFTPEELDPDDV